MPPSSLELQFDAFWESRYPNIDLDTEQLLIPDRNYRFDYVHFPSLVAVEINGGIWQKSGHSTGRGLLRDYEKLNLAQSLGYCVFQLSAEMICDRWIDLIATTILERR